MLIAHCLLDTESFASKAEAVADIKGINWRLPRCETSITVRKLSKAIANGQAWCPSTFTKTSRKAENFASLQLGFADVDASGHDIPSLLKLPLCQKHPPNIIHESYSSAPGHRKWRIVWRLDEPIVDISQAYHVLTALGEGTDADMPVQEPARLLFGTKPNAELYLHMAPCVNVVALLGIALTRPVRRSQSVQLEPVEGPFDINQLSPKQRRVYMLVLSDCNTWLTDPSTIGSRYEALWASARKLGQLSFVPDDKIATLLLGAIAGYEHWTSWDKYCKALQILRNGLTWGRKHGRAL